VKRYFIAIICMFAFAFPFTAQAEPSMVVPAYVAEVSPGPGSSAKAETISEGKETTAAKNYNFEHPVSGAVAAISGMACKNQIEDCMYADIGAGSGGVHRGGTTGISKTS